jgi:hypothetical protein
MWQWVLVAIVALGPAQAGQASKPDFSGTWVDARYRQHLVEDFTLTIAQDGKQITLTTTVASPVHRATQSILFALDGSETKTTNPACVLTTKAAWLGEKLVLTEHREPPAKAYAADSKHVLSFNASGELVDEYTGMMDNLTVQTVHYLYRRVTK